MANARKDWDEESIAGMRRLHYYVSGTEPVISAHGEWLMENTLLLLYPAALGILLFAGSRVSFSGKTRPEYLAPDQTRQIQGAAGIGIILHHLTQQITAYGYSWKGPVTLFAFAGFLLTAIFFFCSGYGLITSLTVKPGYLRHFPARRLPAVLIPFWSVNLLLVLLNRFAFGMHSSTGEMMRRIIGLELVNSNGWFIVEIVILYLLFYVLFRLIPNRDAALACLCAAVILLMRSAFFRGHDTGENIHWFRGEWWYNSTPAFLFGALYARLRGKIDPWIARGDHYKALLGASALLCPVSFFLSIRVLLRYGYYETGTAAARYALITLIAQTSAVFFFCALVFLLNMRIAVGNRPLRYLGSIRMELFLVHNFFVSGVFGAARMSSFLRWLLVIGCSILCAAVLSLPIRHLTGAVTRCLDRLIGTGDAPGVRKAAPKPAHLHRNAGRIAAAVVLAGILAFLLLTFARYLLSGAEYRQEQEALRRAGIGDEVQWGRFETNLTRPGKERLTWIVIGKEKGKIRLLSRYGIAGSSYNRRHEAVTWENADLRAYLNSQRFTGMFSRYEAADVLTVNGDQITLLTVQDALALFPGDRERELAVTVAAEQAGTNVNRASKTNYWDMKGYRSSWWWLRQEKGEQSVCAPIVTADGSVLSDEKAVNKPGGAIRPVIWVKTGP